MFSYSRLLKTAQTVDELVPCVRPLLQTPLDHFINTILSDVQFDVRAVHAYLQSIEVMDIPTSDENCLNHGLNQSFASSGAATKW